LIREWAADVSAPGPSALFASADGYVYVGGYFSNGSQLMNSVTRFTQQGVGLRDTAWALTPTPSSPRALLLDEAGSICLSHASRLSRYDIASSGLIWQTATWSTASRLALRSSHLCASGYACAGTSGSPPCSVLRIHRESGLLDQGWNFSPPPEVPAE